MLTNSTQRAMTTWPVPTRSSSLVGSCVSTCTCGFHDSPDNRAVEAYTTTWAACRTTDDHGDKLAGHKFATGMRNSL